MSDGSICLRADMDFELLESASRDRIDKIELFRRLTSTKFKSSCLVFFFFFFFSNRIRLVFTRKSARRYTPRSRKSAIFVTWFISLDTLSLPRARSFEDLREELDLNEAKGRDKGQTTRKNSTRTNNLTSYRFGTHYRSVNSGCLRFEWKI